MATEMTYTQEQHEESERQLRAWQDRTMMAEAELGDLIDALHDELAYEVSRNPHVLGHIEKACALLGGNYLPYIGAWL